MKLVTFTIPCYNSQAYMRKCVESILVAGEEAEIIIVNDGSHDDTITIAREYEQKYPTIVKVIDKENGGHGSGVNAGLQNASGLYYKVVDSDDYLAEEPLLKLMETIREHVAEDKGADLYVTNFVYDKVDGSSYVSGYSKKMPPNKFITWNDVKPFKLWEIMMMHALLYKTQVLRDCGLNLPEHTFYVDNIYAYQPLPFVKSIYYLDVDLYMYYIGRADQSVTMENIVKRYDQQLRVMRIMLGLYTYDEIKKMPKRLQKMMFHVLMCIMMNTIFFTTAQDTPERRAAYKALWADFKAMDKKLYGKIKFRSLCCIFNLMTYRMTGAVSTWGYKWLCKHVKLGM